MHLDELLLGRTCGRTGVYRSNDCGYEIKLLAGDVFPECMAHDKPVTWAFIRKLELSSSILGARLQSKSS